MTLKQIEYFQKVCQTGNISKAAEELYISRSVISRTIAELEEEFHAKIFTRSKNGVELTSEGEILVNLFTAFQSGYTAAQERIEHLKEEGKMNRLTVGVTPTNAYFVYQRYLEKFQALYPETKIIIEEHGANDIIPYLLDGTFDFCFTPARTDDCFLQTIELYYNPITIGVMEDDPLSQKESIDISDLIDLPLGFYAAPMPVERMLQSCFQAMGKTLNVVVRTSDCALLQELTVKRRVYPVLPRDMISAWDGIRQMPLSFIPTSQNRLVWNTAIRPSDTMRTFLDYMKENYEV